MPRTGSEPERSTAADVAELQTSLDAVVEAAERSLHTDRLILRKAKAVARRLAAGRPHREAVEAGGRRLLVELLRGSRKPAV